MKQILDIILIVLCSIGAIAFLVIAFAACVASSRSSEIDEIYKKGDKNGN